MYVKPGTNPNMNTRYVIDACRRTTSCSDVEAYLATAGRSGPFSPP